MYVEATTELDCPDVRIGIAAGGARGARNSRAVAISRRMTDRTIRAGVLVVRRLVDGGVRDDCVQGNVVGTLRVRRYGGKGWPPRQGA